MGESSEKAQVIGRYALFDSIAAGGMATVHLGRLLGPVGFSRTVAIKRLHHEFARDPEFVSMFLDEARLAARIRHPNVVPTLDVVATKGELFLVMEYVQGESLSQLMKRARETKEPIPPRITVSIMSGALQGLHAAHEARDERGIGLGIVHRDVSPQNVLVGVDGMSRVLDFGVAKAAGRTQTTREGQIKGKLAYMAPEQLQADSIDRKADVYAAGVVLWEMLAGERLFRGETEAVVLARVIGGEVRKPSEVVPGLGKAFDEVVLKGVARNPSQRYATAKEMALALEECHGTASLQEVSSWIERVAGPTLHARASMIARIEVDSEIHTGPQLIQRMNEELARKSDPPEAKFTSTRLGIGAKIPPLPARARGNNPPPVVPSLAPAAPEPFIRNESHSSISTVATVEDGLPKNRTRVYVGAAAIAVVLALLVGFVKSRGSNDADTSTTANHGNAPTHAAIREPDFPSLPSIPSSPPIETATSHGVEPKPSATEPTPTPRPSATRPTAVSTTTTQPKQTSSKSTASPSNPFDLGGRN